VQVPLWQQIAAGVIFLGVYVTIATEKIDKTKVALAGAALMLLLGIVSQHDAFGQSELRMTSVEHFAQQAERMGPHGEKVQQAAGTLGRAGLTDVPGIDWNIIILLISMMVYVGIMGKTGVFEWIAIKCAKLARGEPVLIMVLLSTVTAVVSAWLDNVTTVLLMAPVTLLVCDALGVSPIPMLIAGALASNIGGTATLIGDPPNILIGSKAGFGFNAFLVHLSPVIAVVTVAFAGYAALAWRRTLRAEPQRKAEIMQLDESESIKDRRLLSKCLVVGGLILVGFVLHRRLGWEPATVALCGASALLLISGLRVEEAAETVEWGTIFFFTGLFIMVGALVKVGLIAQASRLILREFGDNTTVLTYVILWFSAFASAGMGNVPYVIAVCPLVSSVVQGMTGQPAVQASADPSIMPIWWALALGACLGGNGTLVGAAANVVIVGVARRHGHKITFMEFTRYGFPVMLWTVGVSMIYLWLRYLR